MSISTSLNNLKSSLPEHVTLVAVSKTKPLDLLKEAYDSGQRHFGENRVQELVGKAETLPKDILWHQIGHLQSNKVKFIAPFVHLIHAVDSEKLILEIDKRAKENKRVIQILIQFYIAKEESKHGFHLDDFQLLIDQGLFERCDNISVSGLMGMATFTTDQEQIRKEFKHLKNLFDQLKPKFNSSFNTLSMGMSGDYSIAIEEGSNMIRVGSKIFGSRA